MKYASIVAQLIIAVGILNVWLLRFNRATPFRGGSAKNMREEFAAYGLPEWFMWGVGGLKILFALSLLGGLFVPQLVGPTAIGMAILMVGAVLMHIKVKDELKKAAPASLLLALSLFVALSTLSG